MAISKELQMGKAAEHLVCCDLILKGQNAFLADQGLPYDVLVDIGSRILRIQVKSTGKLNSYPKAENIYRFGIRCGRGSFQRADESSIDYFAFVALDILKIAYIPISDMTARTGLIKQTIDFKSRRIEYIGRTYPGGKSRIPVWGKHIEDFQEFNPA